MKTTFSDNLNLLSKMTPGRAINAARILTSYYRARRSGYPNILGMPISVAVEPTTSCNLRCPECPSGLRSFTRPTGMLDPLLFDTVINQLAPTLSYLTFYFQGEPYLHNDFLSMVANASRKGVYTATSTNAHYLNDEMSRQTVLSSLDRLIISIDGTEQETYASYRKGGSLEKVIEGTANILRWKKSLRSKTPHVAFQFLVVRPNEHQIPAVYELAKKLGVDSVSLKTAQIYDYENGSDLIPTQAQYARYVKTPGGKYALKNSLENDCWKMWHSCVITWDGKVVPCCFDKDAKYVLGDVNHSTMKEIWNGESYREFRTSLLRSRSELEICRNCSEGTKVWA